MSKLAVVILAAGQGTRMKSERVKVLHEILGRPMIDYPAAAAAALSPERIAVVVGVQADLVKKALAGSKVRFALQKEQKGTGHAVLSALPALRGFSGDVLVFYGDGPCLRPETFKSLLIHHRRSRAAMSLLTVDFEDPTGYGRILRDPAGRVIGIIEDKDCTPEQRRWKESNPGIYCYRMDFLKKFLPRIGNNNRQGEYYLTDLVAIAVERGLKLASLKAADPEEFLGVNSRRELAQAERILAERINRGHLANGVTIHRPESVLIGPSVKIAKESVIEPGVMILGETEIKSGAHIEMHARIEDSKIGEGVRIKAGSVIESSVVKARAQVGPMAHLRPGAVIGRNARIGNFVEIKKARIGDETKVSHLTYVGDAEIGKRVNLGCGFITCNYDGEKKWLTVVEDDVFVGSDTQAVAPVKIGKGSYIGSGSTITRDVPPGSLALTRSPQAVKEGWVKKKKAKRKKKG